MWEETPPEDFAFKLGDDDLDRLGPYIEDAMRRVPLLARLGVKRVVNGPIPYSPDGNPYTRPGAGLAEFLPRQHLLVRHHAGRRRGQGAGGMGRPRRAGIRPLGLRPPPVRRLCGFRLHPRQGDRGLPERIRAGLSVRGASGGTSSQTLAAVRDLAGEGRSVRRAGRMGAGGLLRSRGDRRQAVALLPSPARFRPARRGGGQGGARAGGRARYARLQQIRDQRPRRARLPR